MHRLFEGFEPIEPHPKSRVTALGEWAPHSGVRGVNQSGHKIAEGDALRSLCILTIDF